MPRTAIGPVNADGTGLLYHPGFRTSKPVRIRDVRFFVVATISGGSSLTGQLGYAPSGAEIVASAGIASSALDAESSLPIANKAVPASKVVVWKQTATTRTAGQYFILIDWDDDY